MTQFTISARPLRAALQTALTFTESDPEEAVPTVRAVHLAPGTDEVTIYATDRFVASRETLKAEGDLFGFSIPREAVDQIIAAVRPYDPNDPYREPGIVSFTADGGKVTARIVESEVSTAVTFEPVDGRFQGGVSKIVEVLTGLFKRVAGAGDIVDLAGLNIGADYLSRLSGACAARGVDRIVIVGGGTGAPLVVRQGDRFMAAVMPVQVAEPFRSSEPATAVAS